MADGHTESEGVHWWTVIPDTIKALATLIAALPALISVVAFLQAQKAEKAATVAENGAAKAQVEVQAIQNQAQGQPQAPPQPPVQPAAAGFVVQLATYAGKNCLAAQDEIDLYGNKLNPRPTLWLVTPAGAVVVGIKATTEDQARALQTTARELSKEPTFSHNSLNQARARAIPPGWRQLGSCLELQS